MPCLQLCQLHFVNHTSTFASVLKLQQLNVKTQHRQLLEYVSKSIKKKSPTY